MGKNPINKEVQFWRDPDLPGVEVRYSSYSAKAFCKHTHAEYSVALIETGRTVFSLGDDTHDAVAGQIALVPPETVHACNPDLNSGLSYRLFYVDCSWLEVVAAEMFGCESILPLFPEPVLDDPELFAMWKALYEATVEGAGVLEKQSLLVQAVVGLIANHAKLGEVPSPEIDDGAVQKVKAFLSANLTEKVTLDTLSEVAHLSRYHLLRVFQEAVGLPPHAYQNQLRVNLGKSLLAGEMPISEAAVESGFVDQSHFSRVFKQFTGATPKQYQAGLIRKP